MSPGVSFFIDHCARVDAAKGTSRDEVCERDYPVLFSDDSTLTTVPPLQINTQCGIIQPGRAGIGEVVVEWQWSKEHPSVSIHGCSVLIKEEGFSEEDFFPGSPPFQIRFLHLEWHFTLFPSLAGDSSRPRFHWRHKAFWTESSWQSLLPLLFGLSAGSKACRIPAKQVRPCPLHPPGPCK